MVQPPLPPSSSMQGSSAWSMRPPASSSQLLDDNPDGQPRQQTWHYRSVVGCLSYLQAMIRPDLTMAVQQVARFCHNPKRSHASAVKTIVRYLNRTCEMGMIVKPTGDLSVDCYVDADFAGLHGRDPDRSPSSANSRTGYIITYSWRLPHPLEVSSPDQNLCIYS